MEKLKNNEREWFELDWEECNVITEEIHNTVVDLKKLLLSFIPVEDLNEQSIDADTLIQHFEKHCLIGENSKSKKKNIYYDFNKAEDYGHYEQQLNNKFSYDKKVIAIFSLYETEQIYKAFEKFLHEESYILFTESCCLFNKYGRLCLGLHSYCNSTKNYNKPTIDFCIMSEDLKTISLFPIDFSQLEHDFNNFVEQHCEYKNTKAIKVNASSIPINLKPLTKEQIIAESMQWIKIYTKEIQKVEQERNSILEDLNNKDQAIKDHLLPFYENESISEEEKYRKAEKDYNVIYSEYKNNKDIKSEQIKQLENKIKGLEEKIKQAESKSENYDTPGPEIDDYFKPKHNTDE